jgi:hypothetical protein
MRDIQDIRAVVIVTIALILPGCGPRYGPAVKVVRESQVRDLRTGMTATQVGKILGSPSFVWRRNVFTSQRYPRNPHCAMREPDMMWIYYSVSKGSICVYFASDEHLLCVERNDIVIAQ